MAPVDVAIALRRRIARDALLDPFGWVGILVVSYVLFDLAAAFANGDPARGAAVVVAALAVLVSTTHRTADFLLFEMKENDFLRTQPLGPRGLLLVRAEELGWWSLPPRLIAAAAAFGAGGVAAAAGVFVAGTLLDRTALRLAIVLRRRFEGREAAAGASGALAGALILSTMPGGRLLLPEAASTPAIAGAAVICGGAAWLFGRGLEASFDRDYATAASNASIATPLSAGRTWRLLERVLPLPAAIRIRVVRDLVLLLRGWDGRGLLLLLLSPLAAVFLIGELQGHLRPDALLWRVLQAAALGGAAVAYACGPGVHLLRNAGMVWERTSPNPGAGAGAAAHVYAAGFALLHGVVLLGAAALADGGRHLDLLPRIAPAVLLLELAMAHYTVGYSMTRTTGRRIAGEATLAFALPVVAVAVAGASLFHPALGLVYFVVTAGMFAQGAARYEAVEVTW